MGLFGKPREGDVTVLLSDNRRKQRCSPEFVQDLCDRVLDPAIDELTRTYGDGWCTEVQPSLTLEGPGLGFRFAVVFRRQREFMEMGARINQVLHKYWDQEIDRVPPS